MAPILELKKLTSYEGNGRRPGDHRRKWREKCSVNVCVREHHDGSCVPALNSGGLRSGVRP